MVTFKFDLDGDAPEEIATYMVCPAYSSLQLLPLFATLLKIFKMECLQVENGFILPMEKEIFIDQLKDIVDKAEDMLNEDMDNEKNTGLSCSPLQDQTSEVGEVRKSWISVITHCVWLQRTKITCEHLP